MHLAYSGALTKKIVTCFSNSIFDLLSLSISQLFINTNCANSIENESLSYSLSVLSAILKLYKIGLENELEDIKFDKNSHFISCIIDNQDTKSDRTSKLSFILICKVIP